MLYAILSYYCITHMGIPRCFNEYLCTGAKKCDMLHSIYCPVPHDLSVSLSTIQ